jgi:dipeptidyl aminopeptidase/acylaminoacyl peptidase
MVRGFAAALGLLMALCAMAPAHAQPLPIDAFFSRQAVGGAALSPDGTHLAMTVRNKDTVGVVVQDLAGGASSPALSLNGEPYSVDWVQWKTDQRLLVGVTYLKLDRIDNKPDGKIYGEHYRKLLIAVNRDGKNAVILFNDEKHLANHTRGVFTLLDVLKKDPDHVLVITQDGQGFPGVWKADINTGSAEIIEKGELETRGWQVDSQSNIVLRTQAGYGDERIQARAPGEKTWTTIATIRYHDARELADFEIFGPTDQPNQIYVGVKGKSDQPADTRALRVYDLKTKSVGDPVWPAAKYDLKAIVYRANSYDLEGVCFVVDVLACQFKDKTVDANFQGIEKFFGGDRNVERLSSSDDGRLWLLDVSGPDEPGSLYLYDWRARHLDFLVSRFPNLPAEKLGTMQRFAFTDRDGVTIPGYVTLPPGAPKGPLPMVVMPHGGPEVRDDFGYDALVQAIATRGYLVFQPNFRGSGGYGARYAEAGYGEWGGRMQDDVTDGVKALIQQGRADPNRICIFGASYGGYAALMGGASTPELYKCVVSMAGLSDLNDLIDWNLHAYGSDSERYRYSLKSMGDPFHEHDKLRRDSPVSYASKYQPPVLLLSGDGDVISPLKQSQMMESALKKAGKDVRLVVYKTEGHPYWSDDHMKDAMTQVTAFIQDHIGPGVQPAAPAVASHAGS